MSSFDRPSINQRGSSLSLSEMREASQQTVDRLGTPTSSADTTPPSLPSRAKTSDHRPAAPVDKSNGDEDCQDDQPLQTNHSDRIDAILEELWSGIQAMKQNVSGYIDPYRACYLCDQMPGLVEYYKHCESLLVEIAGDPVAIEKPGEEEIQRWQRRMTTEGWKLGQTNYLLGKPVPDSDLPSAVRMWN